MPERISYLEQILQAESAFSDDYLTEVLHLPLDSKIFSKKILEDKSTDTTRIIKLLVNWTAKDESEHIKKLFLKLPVVGKEENAFDQWSRHEIDFYKNAGRNDGLPIVKCHDAYIFDDKKRFLLLLDDISDDYYAANEINRNDLGNWMIAAESLAKIHSFFWNGANSGKLKNLHGDVKSLEEKIQNYHNALDKFLAYASDYYGTEILDVYQSALEDAILFERNNITRREQNNNITIIHGDSHIFNVMFPKEEAIHKPLVVDFQFWRMGIAAVDIMNLTRVAFPFANDSENYLKLLMHYHRQLQENGVKNYDFNEFLKDYYMAAAMAVFGPVFNYFEFGLGYEYWGKGVFDTINNYKMAKSLLKENK